MTYLHIGNVKFARWRWKRLRRLDGYQASYNKLDLKNDRAVKGFCESWNLIFPLDYKLTYDDLKKEYYKFFEKEYSKENDPPNNIDEFLYVLIMPDSWDPPVDDFKNYISYEADGIQWNKPGVDFTDKGILHLKINLNWDKKTITDDLLKVVKLWKARYDNLDKEADKEIENLKYKGTGRIPAIEQQVASYLKAEKESREDAREEVKSMKAVPGFEIELDDKRIEHLCEIWDMREAQVKPIPYKEIAKKVFPKMPLKQAISLLERDHKASIKFVRGEYIPHETKKKMKEEAPLDKGCDFIKCKNQTPEEYEKCISNILKDRLPLCPGAAKWVGKDWGKVGRMSYMENEKLDALAHSSHGSRAKKKQTLSELT